MWKFFSTITKELSLYWFFFFNTWIKNPFCIISFVHLTCIGLPSYAIFLVIFVTSFTYYWCLLLKYFIDPNTTDFLPINQELLDKEYFSFYKSKVFKLLFNYDLNLGEDNNTNPLIELLDQVLLYIQYRYIFSAFSKSYFLIYSLLRFIKNKDQHILYKITLTLFFIFFLVYFYKLILLAKLYFPILANLNPIIYLFFTIVPLRVIHISFNDSAAFRSINLKFDKDFIKNLLNKTSWAFYNCWVNILRVNLYVSKLRIYKTKNTIWNFNPDKKSFFV